MKVTTPKLTEALEKNAAVSPRAGLVRDAIAIQPGGVSELLIHLAEDLELALRQITQLPSMPHETQELVDLRITVEHLLILLAQMFPLVITAMADLYMTDVSEMRIQRINRASIVAFEAELRELRDRWLLIESTRASSRSKKVSQWVLLANWVSTLSLTLTRLLSHVMLGNAPENDSV